MNKKKDAAIVLRSTATKDLVLDTARFFGRRGDLRMTNKVVVLNKVKDRALDLFDTERFLASLKIATFFLFIFFLASSAFSEGRLPPKNSAVAVTPPHPLPDYLLIGQPVRDDVWVIDETGKLRTLNSYKTPINVMVVLFLSPNCSYNQAAWKDLKIFYDFYKGWYVNFVAVASNTGENLQELSSALQQAEITIPVVQDKNQQVARLLHALATPEIVILDEESKVRYRGPLNDRIKSAPTLEARGFAYDAMNAVIGHTDTVPTPEPDALIGCPIQ